MVLRCTEEVPWKPAEQTRLRHLPRDESGRDSEAPAQALSPGRLDKSREQPGPSGLGIFESRWKHTPREPKPQCRIKRQNERHGQPADDRSVADRNQEQPVERGEKERQACEVTCPKGHAGFWRRDPPAELSGRDPGEARDVQFRKRASQQSPPQPASACRRHSPPAIRNLTRSPVRLMQFDALRLAQANVQHFHTHREGHREVNVALRDLLVERFGDKHHAN